MTGRITALAGALWMLLVHGSDLMAQVGHADIQIQQNTAGTQVVLYDPNTPSNIVFGNTFHPTIFRTADPGYASDASSLPAGIAPLPADTFLDFNLRAFSIDGGPASNLFYWDGTGTIDVDSWVAPPADHAVTHYSSFLSTQRATVDGGASDVEGFDSLYFLETDGSSFIHQHHIFELEAPGTPASGAYLFSMSISAEGLDESDPIYLVLGFPDPVGITTPATAWAVNNVDLFQQPVAVPEPTTWALACCGGVILFTLLWRRRRSKLKPM